jgi:hypothetical protein
MLTNQLRWLSTECTLCLKLNENCTFDTKTTFEDDQTLNLCKPIWLSITENDNRPVRIYMQASSFSEVSPDVNGEDKHIIIRFKDDFEHLDIQDSITSIQDSFLDPVLVFDGTDGLTATMTPFFFIQAYVAMTADYTYLRNYTWKQSFVFTVEIEEP